MTKHLGIGVAVAVAMLLSPERSRAQERVPPNKNERHGFFIAFGLGPGTLSIEGNDDTAVSSMLRMGVASSQKVCVGFDMNSMFLSSLGVFFTALTGGVLFYPSANAGFFLTGGVGLGIELNGEGGGIGPAGRLGLGYDFRVGKSTSVTPFLNGFASSIEDSWNLQGPESYNLVQAGVGVTFH